MNMFTRRVLLLLLVCEPLSAQLEAVKWWPKDGGNGNYYCLHKTTRLWPDAQAYAESIGGWLASIHSAEENAFIEENFAPSRSRFPYWIGFTDIGFEGDFRWSSGEPASYLNWDPGEPNGDNGGEDFVVMLPDGTWNDGTNDSRFWSIIELTPSGISVEELALSRLSGDRYSLSWTWREGCSYAIEYSSTLAEGSWELLTVLSVEPGSHFEIEPPGNPSKQFYRVIELCATPQS